MSQDQTNAPRWAANTTEAERAYFAAENVAQATRRARLLVRDIINQRAPVIAPVSADEVAEVTQAVNFVVAYCRRTEDLSPLRTLRDDVDAWGWLMAWASTEAEREDVAADAVAMMMGEPSPPPPRPRACRNWPRPWPLYISRWKPPRNYPRKYE